MRRIFILFMLTVAVIGIFPIRAAEHVDANPGEKTKKEVLQVERELSQAVLKNDTSTLDRIFADQMVWLTSTGQFLSKTEVLADIRARNLAEFSFKSNDDELRVYGDTVVLYRKTPGNEKDSNKNEILPKTITDVFVKQDGKWKIVAHGATVIAQ
ncbi:MAG TPA: nuclear transport factor 2 family protein [Candidatus Acidoferrales bacterium]